MVSSLCGTDDYANNKRLYANPAQTLCILTKKTVKFVLIISNFKQHKIIKEKSKYGTKDY